MRRVAAVMALASIGTVVLFAGTAQAHQGVCTETTNPHGQTVPPAGSTTLPGPNGGQNEDGFYVISSNTRVQVFVKDLGSGTIFRTVRQRDEDQVHAGSGRDAERGEDRKHRRPGRSGPVPHHRHRGCLCVPDWRTRARRVLPGPTAAKVDVEQLLSNQSVETLGGRFSRRDATESPSRHLALDAATREARTAGSLSLVRLNRLNSGNGCKSRESGLAAVGLSGPFPGFAAAPVSKWFANRAPLGAPTSPAAARPPIACFSAPCPVQVGQPGARRLAILGDSF
jgi:hypothetical protein